MTKNKIPLSQVLRNNNYAIRIKKIEEAKALVPHYNRLEDLQSFFAIDKHHREYVAGTHHPSGSGFYFQHPEGKTIVEFEDVEFDI